MIKLKLLCTKLDPNLTITARGDSSQTVEKSVEESTRAHAAQSRHTAKRCLEPRHAPNGTKANGIHNLRPRQPSSVSTFVFCACSEDRTGWNVGGTGSATFPNHTVFTFVLMEQKMVCGWGFRYEAGRLREPGKTESSNTFLSEAVQFLTVTLQFLTVTL